MEKRNANIIVGAAGGTAGGNSKTYKISLPTKWVTELKLTDNGAELCYDGEKIVILPRLSFEEFYANKKAKGHKLLHMEFYDKNVLCTEICADQNDKTLSVKNYTDNIVKTAFGNNLFPDWTDFEVFLEERCVPESRSGIREYLEALGLDRYDPLEIIKKTGGRMAEDEQWIKTEEIK